MAITIFPAVSGGDMGTSDVTLPINQSDVTGLVSALNSKSATTHNHALNNLSEKSYNSLSNKPNIPSLTSQLENDSSFTTLATVKLDSDISKSISESHSHSNASALALVSGTNTGDQNLSGYSLISHSHNLASLDERAYDSLTSKPDLTKYKVFHGIQTAGTLSFNNTSHIVTIGLSGGHIIYWYNGTKYDTTSTITCDIDDYVTLTTNTLYYIYFDNSTGTLKASATAWDLFSVVPVATVFWNGSAGAICNEKHGYSRDINWHEWAHDTVGARISPADFAKTNPSSGTPASISIAGGILHDEDIELSIGTLTNARLWYETANNTWTFEDVTTPYLWSGSVVQYINGSYAKTTLSNNYTVVWAYVSNDVDRPLYLISMINSNYNTTTLARNESVPNLSSLPFNKELKLIYRFIFKGDGTYQTGTTDDYRNTATLPSGGTTTPSASSVLYLAGGNISATNVQSAIEELDTEKQAVLTSGTTIKTVNNTSLLGSGDIAIAGGMWSDLPAAPTKTGTSTFTFSGTQTDANKCIDSLFKYSNAGNITASYIKTAVHNTGTVTCTLASAILVDGGTSYKYTPTLKLKDIQHLTSVPGEIIADTATNAGTYKLKQRAQSLLLAIDVMVKSIATGTTSATSVNAYHNPTNNPAYVTMFSSAVSLGSAALSFDNVPNFMTLEQHENYEIRVTESAGGTTKAQDLQIKSYIVPRYIFDSE